jgi:hypothetical protein
MGISFKSNFDPKKILADKLARARDALDVALQYEATEIKRNMSAGKSYDGSAFAKYSKGYEDYKKAIGRNTQVDLTLTGKLRDSIQPKAAKINTNNVEGGIFIANLPGTTPPKRPSKRKRRATVAQRPANTIEKAHFIQEGRVPRKFFGLSNDAIKRIIKRVQEAFNK